MFNLEYDRILARMFQKHKKLSKVKQFERIISDYKKSEKEFAEYAKDYVKHEIYNAEFFGDISKKDAKQLMKLH